MKKSISLYAFFVIALSIWSNAVFALPTITATTSQGTTIKFTATLSEKLLSGYKVKIDYGNGKGLVAMTCSGIICTLSSNVLPAGVSKAAYKIGVYNARGALQGLTTDGTYAITYSAPVINSPTTLATAYTKISNTGAILPDTTVLGSGANDWSCTKDNKTGLVWEVKTDDNSFRDKDWYYSWYDPSSAQAGSYSGLPNNGYCQGNDCDTNAYKNAVNKQTLCGASNWRAPTNEELKNLVFCADGQYNLTPNKSGYICTTNTQVSNTPFINTTYFPNTQAFPFWSSSTYTGNSTKALWGIDFGSGYTDFLNGSQYYVRLVHEDKSVTDYLTAQKAVADKTATDYLSILKATAEKTAADYSTSLKSTADKTVADYLNTQKAAADKTAADYLAKLKAAADISNSTTSTTSSNGYVKISNTGTTLPDSAKLGAGANDWSCTKDNKTGLIWEVKTKDGGVRDTSKTFTNYPIGSAGYYGAITNTDGYIIAVNKQILCGSKDWRVPTRNELISLVSCPDNKYNILGQDEIGYICTNYRTIPKPAINTAYFPDIADDVYYWTSSLYTNHSPGASVYFFYGNWMVYFGWGDATYSNTQNDNNHIRLVHS